MINNELTTNKLYFLLPPETRSRRFEMFPSSPKLLRIILRSISTDVSSLSLNTLLSLAQALKYGRDIKALFDKYVTYEFTIKHVMEILKFNHCFESMQQIGILVFLELHFSQCKLQAKG